MSDSEKDFSTYTDNELDSMWKLCMPDSTLAKKNKGKAERRQQRIGLEQKLRRQAKADAEVARAREIADKCTDILMVQLPSQELVAKHHAKWLPTAKDAVEWLRKVTKATDTNDFSIKLFAKHHPEDLLAWARQNPETVSDEPSLSQIASMLENTAPVVRVEFTDSTYDLEPEDEAPISFKYSERMNGEDAVSLALLVKNQEPLGLLGLARLFRRTRVMTWATEQMDLLGRKTLSGKREGVIELDARLPVKDETTVFLPADGKLSYFLHRDACYLCEERSNLTCDVCGGHFRACRSFDAVAYMVVKGFARKGHPSDFVTVHGALYNADRVSRGLPPIDLKKHSAFIEEDSESGSGSESESGSD